VIRDLGLPVEVLGCPTLRESDGLAMSSRNRYLSAEQRQRARALSRALLAARDSSQTGQDLAEVCRAVRRQLEAAGLVVDYVEAVAPDSLQPRSHLRSLTLLAAAAHCGPSRLIDHQFLMSRQPIVAIDGPAGAGKSTVTRAFAERLGLIYLDTGAMYRAVTWLVLHHGVDPADGTAVATLLTDLDLQLSNSAKGGQRVSVNSHDVTAAIRSRWWPPTPACAKR
jgi:pantoate ligase/cytidylate kinase